MPPEVGSKWRAYGGTRSLWEYVGPAPPSEEGEDRYRILCLEPREGSSYIAGESTLDVPLSWFRLATREE